jgi:regulator of sigma E protease
VLEIDGKTVISFEDIRREVMIALDQPMNFLVQRGDETITLTATPKKELITDHFGFEHSRGLLGIIGPANGVLLKMSRP